jgi:ribonuclease R
MLPHQLSNGICSLNPHVDRLVMACDMEIDRNGTVLNYDIYEGVINSHARMTYEKVNLMLEKNDEKTIKEYEELYPMFLLMQELSVVLYNKRQKRGSLDFETAESKIIVDELGHVLDIQLRSRGLGEKLIEEFMLIANETVATAMTWQNCPFVYRIHEEPDGEKLQKIIAIARALGYNIKGRENKIHPHSLQQLLADVKGEPAELAINTLLLRSMAKAKYSPNNVGHYGLASECYCHFTSPIRRYPDLLVHRLIKEFMLSHESDQYKHDYFTYKVTEASVQSSKKERDSIDCENEVDDMKKAEYMIKFIGETFEGVISSLSNWGMYVELPNTVEGLVQVMDMRDDYYNFDPNLMIMVGENTKKVYRMGDSVKVKLLSASKEEREINFELVEAPKKKRVKKYEEQRTENIMPKQKGVS